MDTLNENFQSIFSKDRERIKKSQGSTVYHTSFDIFLTSDACKMITTTVTSDTRSSIATLEKPNNLHYTYPHAKQKKKKIRNP